MYGFIAEDEPVQLVTFRVEATGLVRKADLRREPLGGADARGGMVRSRKDRR